MTPTPMLPISATPLPHRGKSLWPFAALYASAKLPQNPLKTRMNSAILNSRVLLRPYKHGTLQLHNATIKYQQVIVRCHGHCHVKGSSSRDGMIFRYTYIVAL